MDEITVLEVVEQLEANQNLNFIDVREDDEVAEGIIPGAVHIPLGEIPTRVNELDKAKEYIIVCAAGGRSANATEYLMASGYKVKNMLGGMMNWTGEVVV